MCLGFAAKASVATLAKVAVASSGFEAVLGKTRRTEFEHEQEHESQTVHWRNR